MRRTVLIVTYRGDIHAETVRHALHTRGVAVHMIDLSRFPTTARASFYLNDVIERRYCEDGDSISLDTVTSVWWRRPSLCNVPRTFSGLDHQVLQAESDQFVEGLLWSCREALWVNDPMCQYRATRKLFQLRVARDVGLRTPKTLITNDPVMAAEFIGSLPGKAIVKRTGAKGGPPMARTTIVTQDVLARLHTISSAPATFQEYVDARGDIRVTWIGDQGYAAFIDSQAGTSPEDCRHDTTVAYSRYQLDSVTTNQLAALMKRLGLVYGAIDLRIDTRGEVVFLEVNPAGQYGYIEARTELPLTSSMAALLTNAADETVQPRRASSGS